MASIQWTPKSAIVYGELIEESIFSARAIYQDSDGDDYSPEGTYTYTYEGLINSAENGALTAGLKLEVAAYVLTVTFDPADATLGGNISSTAGITVRKATPVVIWNNPPDITYKLDSDGNGPKLTSRQLNAIADVPGTFAYTPAIDSSLSAGTQTVSATFTPTDTRNYNSLPAEGDTLQIQFKVLKGDVVIEVPIFKNGVYEKRFTDPTENPPSTFTETKHTLNFSSLGGTVKATNSGKEISGTFAFDPAEGTELEESTNVTITFTPDDASNWATATLTKTVVYPVYKRITGPIPAPTMFGCAVQSVNASIGWGGNSSTCDLVLVEDPDNGLNWSDPTIGSACYFKYNGFYFGGILSRFTYSNTTQGRTYKVLLESPAKLLDGVQVIMDGFEGTGYNYGTGYNRYNPSENPNFTTGAEKGIHNVYNVLGHFENTGINEDRTFGDADVNSAGFPARKLFETVELLSCPDENPPNSETGEFLFAQRCTFGNQEFYKIDLSDFTVVNAGRDDVLRVGNDSGTAAVARGEAILPNNFYRISGNSQNLNSIISDVAESAQYDYIVLVNPKGGTDAIDLLPNGGGTITDPVIKIRVTDKGSQPAVGVVKGFVEGDTFKDKLISSSVGEELTDDTTQTMVLGGPASRMVTRFVNTSTAFPIWGKLPNGNYVFDSGATGASVYIYDFYEDALDANRTIPVLYDPYDGVTTANTYNATIFELRMATGGMELVI